MTEEAENVVGRTGFWPKRVGYVQNMAEVDGGKGPERYGPLK